MRMSLSLKECNQKTGKDLNPSNKHDVSKFTSFYYRKATLQMMEGFISVQFEIQFARAYSF